MKGIQLFFMISVLLLGACEKENVDHQLKSGALGVSLPDTVEFNMMDTLFLEGSVEWISFTDVPEDSRCPVNAQCVWAGNAITRLNYYDGSIMHELELHTHPYYRNDTIVRGLYFKMIELLPYPFAGKETNPDDFMASIFITDDTAAMKGNENTGTVVDYTGLDGCGFIIELDNGEKLEPAVYPEGFQFYDCQRVVVEYEVMSDAASICMVGDIVEITSIQNLGCPPYAIMAFDQKIDELPSDQLIINDVTIEDGCIYINLGYSGGCKEHEIELVQMPLFCGTPPIPDPMFYLTHDANGDLCEAFITEELQYDLKPLKNQYPEGTKLTIMTPDRAYSKELEIEF